MNKVMNALNEVREKCLNGEQISGLKISAKHKAGVPNMMKYLCELGYVQKIKSGKYRWKVGEVIPVMAKAVSDLAKSKRTKVTTLDQMDTLLKIQSAESKEEVVDIIVSVGTVFPHKTDEANAEFKKRYIDPMFETEYNDAYDSEIDNENSELKKRVEELEKKLSETGEEGQMYLDWWYKAKDQIAEMQKAFDSNDKELKRAYDTVDAREREIKRLREENLVKYKKVSIFGITVFKIERR